eukprot:TRINITY_DN22660_c0_g1_i1.p1 TRINITY_DN22660_c0_g1~~TRINITY_DN22660_c0_g1_i1.p1  ORF type:complete len:462 (+),score=109.14 TRINITY_DN22660_c0_g1_i1:41-1387(+)
MEGDSSFEGRLRYLEQGSQQLKQQMQMMKTLVTTEVDELKGVLRQQVEDMKEIIIHQDRLYQERIRRLEARVEQLAEFSMHLAQSKGMMGTLKTDVNNSTLESPGRGPPAVGRQLDVETPLPQAVLGGARDSDGDDDFHERSGLHAIIHKYKDKIMQVYKHYTETASRALHPVMTLHQFSKFTKDCGLCNSSQGGTVSVNSYLPPPELLWMNIMRRLPKKKGKRGAATSSQFAFERVQEIGADSFPDALVILAEEQYGRDRQDMDRPQVVELFLVNDVFPVTDLKISEASAKKTVQLEKRHTSKAASSINDYYDNDDVKESLKEYRVKLNNTYQKYVTKYHTIYKRSDKLSLQGFSDFIRDHQLLPLINKADVRQIFLNVVQTQSAMSYAEGGHQPAAEDLEIDKKGFLMALRHVAEHIYGERAMAEKYQTPDARMRKLLSKVYLLSS